MYNFDAARRLACVLAFAIAIGLYATPARAALSCNNGSGNTCLTSATCAEAFGTNPTAGDILYVTGAITSTSFTLTIASTLDGTWHQAQVAASPVNGSTTVQQYLWWVKSAGGGADTATISGGSAAQNIIMVVGECTNGATANWTEDKGKSSSGNSASLSSGTTTATAQANEVVITGFASLGGTIPTPTGYTLFNSQTFVIMAWKVVAATGTQVATTSAVSAEWTGNIDTFYVAASGVVTPRLTLVGAGS
jgi:hypothetical protein